MRKVGFFGGSFDPIHFGHLNLAINILEKKHLDHIFFCPANYSPAKGGNTPIAKNKARKEMTQLAIEGMSSFSLLDTELNREGPSYTIDTIQLLIKQNPHTTFHLILGEDALIGLASWKEISLLLQLARPLIGTRKSDPIPPLPLELQEIVEQGRVPISTMEISSTQLRLRLKQKKYCGHLVPDKVLSYIEAHEVY